MPEVTIIKYSDSVPVDYLPVKKYKQTDKKCQIPCTYKGKFAKYSNVYNTNTK